MAVVERKNIPLLLRMLPVDHLRGVADVLEEQARDFTRIEAEYLRSCPPPEPEDCVHCLSCKYVGLPSEMRLHEWRQHVVGPQEGVRAIEAAIRSKIADLGSKQLLELFAAARPKASKPRAAKRSRRQPAPTLARGDDLPPAEEPDSQSGRANAVVAVVPAPQLSRPATKSAAPCPTPVPMKKVPIPPANVPAAVPDDPVELDYSALIRLPPDEQQVELGYRLSKRIPIRLAPLAGRIVGMLLESDAVDVVFLLEHPAELAEKIVASVSLLARMAPMANDDPDPDRPRKRPATGGQRPADDTEVSPHPHGATVRPLAVVAAVTVFPSGICATESVAALCESAGCHTSPEAVCAISNTVSGVPAAPGNVWIAVKASAVYPQMPALGTIQKGSECFQASDDLWSTCVNFIAIESVERWEPMSCFTLRGPPQSMSTARLVAAIVEEPPGHFTTAFPPFAPSICGCLIALYSLGLPEHCQAWTGTNCPVASMALPSTARRMGCGPKACEKWRCFSCNAVHAHGEACSICFEVSDTETAAVPHPGPKRQQCMMCHRLLVTQSNRNLGCPRCRPSAPLAPETFSHVLVPLIAAAAEHPHPGVAPLRTFVSPTLLGDAVAVVRRLAGHRLSLLTWSNNYVPASVQNSLLQDCWAEPQFAAFVERARLFPRGPAVPPADLAQGRPARAPSTWRCPGCNTHLPLGDACFGCAQREDDAPLATPRAPPSNATHPLPPIVPSRADPLLSPTSSSEVSSPSTSSGSGGLLASVSSSVVPSSESEDLLPPSMPSRRPARVAVRAPLPVPDSPPPMSGRLPVSSCPDEAAQPFPVTCSLPAAPVAPHPRTPLPVCNCGRIGTGRQGRHCAGCPRSSQVVRERITPCGVPNSQLLPESGPGDDDPTWAPPISYLELAALDVPLFSSVPRGARFAVSSALAAAAIGASEASFWRTLAFPKLVLSVPNLARGGTTARTKVLLRRALQFGTKHYEALFQEAKLAVRVTQTDAEPPVSWPVEDQSPGLILDTDVDPARVPPCVVERAAALARQGFVGRAAACLRCAAKAPVNEETVNLLRLPAPGFGIPWARRGGRASLDRQPFGGCSSPSSPHVPSRFFRRSIWIDPATSVGIVQCPRLRAP